MTPENLYAFDSWLHARTCKQKESERLAGNKPRKISDTGVHNYHKNLKALLNRAVKMGKITANPYDRLRGEFKRGDKQSVPFLTEDEKKAIESLHPVRGSLSLVISSFSKCIQDLVTLTLKRSILRNISK